ncbi:MAG: DUF6107 family protein [Rhizobiaceae bacterium]|nr:DUF6107 family protein [Rhizobiaceae bacterium]
MQHVPDAALEWAVKGAGAVAGSAISLAYVLPRGRREAALRFFVGVACGLVFGGTVGVKLADELGVRTLLGPNETVLTGAAVASLCAWWALGLTLRFFQSEIGKKELKHG